MGEALVLTMDGSTSVCCAAVVAVSESAESGEGRVISRRSETNERGQARILLRQVDEMLREVGAEPGDLTRITVGTGPGTFTGVRIAVATARGLALALGIPVYGASTLSSLAARAIDEASADDLRDWSSVISVVDARRAQVFFAVYESPDENHDPKGRSWTMTRPIGVCNGEALAGTLKEVCTRGVVTVIGHDDVIGSLPEGCHRIVGGVRAEYLVLGQQRLLDVSATHGEGIGVARGDEGDVEGSPERVKPIYVRPPDADIHITKMRDPWAREGAKG